MNIEQKLGYVMLGYEKAIASLMTLDYKSETIQTLVDLIYHVQSDGIDDAGARNYFSEKQIEMMSNRSSDYLEMFTEEEYDYLKKAVTFFGENEYIVDGVPFFGEKA